MPSSAQRPRRSRLRPSSPRGRAASAAWGTLLRAYAELLPPIDNRVQGTTGLSLSWYDVLLELGATDEGRLTMSDLGSRVVLSRTRVSRLVDELERAGLVAREANPEDRRSAFAVLTAAGRTRFEEVAPVYLAAIEELFAAALSTDELTALAEMLDRVRKH
jgi:DNA-binding MarR family transcriptional regulator